jgi:hypothetical protein
LSNFLGLFFLIFYFVLLFNELNNEKIIVLFVVGDQTTASEREFDIRWKDLELMNVINACFKIRLHEYKFKCLYCFFANKIQKKTACNRGILKQVHESSHRWKIIFQRMKQKKDCIHANIQQKGNTRNCVSFFLFFQ